MKVELLVDSAQFWPRLAGDLARARQRVFVQTLSFEGDPAGHALAESLRASRAPDRRVVVDAFTRHVINDRFVMRPSHWFDRGLWREVRATRRMMDELGAAGVGLRFTNPAGFLYLQLPMRNHKKLVTLDGEVVYIGGFNFSEHNFAWHDLMLRIEDRDLTRFIEQDFEHTWRGEHQELTRAFDGVEFHVLSGRGNERQFKSVLGLIAGAKREIFVESAYIGPPFSEALQDAALRGVRVTIVTAEQNNWQLCNDHIHWKACGAPIDIRLYPDRMTHMKAMLVDEATLVLGSANYELWSYRFQQEYVGLFTDPGLIAQFQARVIQPDLAVSRPSHRSVGALRGRLADLRLEWLERLAMGFNGRGFWLPPHGSRAGGIPATSPVRSASEMGTS